MQSQTKIKTTLIFLLAALNLTFFVNAKAETFKAEKLNSVITIDGKLDEPAWQQAQPSSSFKWLENRAEKRTPAKTTFRLLVDADAVYFGIHCEEPLMHKLSAAPLERDGAVWTRDCVEIFLDPEGRGFQYYQLMISAGNSQYDAYYIESGNTTIGQYNARWDSAVYRGKDFWNVEVKIPLAALYYTDSAAFSDTWRINVARERQPEKELTTWSPVQKNFCREADKHNLVANMPRKDKRFDVKIDDVQAFIRSSTGNRFDGTLQIKVLATKATAGEYDLTVSDSSGNGVVEKKGVKISDAENTITLNDVVFKSQGKMLLKLAIQSKNNEIVHEIYSTIKVEYAPIVFDFSSPFYANCIFPGQDVKEIAGNVKINLPTSELKNSELTIALAGPGVTVKPVQKKLKGDESSVEFSFDASPLSCGEYIINCTLVNTGKTIANESATIRKLAPSPGSCVYIDKNLNLVVDGKPVFGRGWYGNEGYMVSQELLKTYPHPNSKFVNMWHSQVSMQAERLDPQNRSAAQLDAEPSAKVFDEMKKGIETNRENRSLWYYYLCDEPECRSISPVYLKHQYEFIKKHDPYHPVLIITRKPSDYVKCADILGVHPYINPMIDASGKRTYQRPPKVTARMIKEILIDGNGKILPWHIPSAFNHGGFDSSGDFPTFTEYRCALYTAIVSGCKGFTPYIYHSHFTSMDLRLGCDFVYETLASIDEFLLSPEKPLPCKIDAPDNGVMVWIKKVNGKIFVIAVNLLSETISADIECEGLKGIDKLFGYREKTGAAVSNGRFKLDFAPLQVHLLSNPKMGENLKTVETLMEEIKAANAALKKPGNILCGRGREIEWDTSDTWLVDNKELYTLTDGICDAYGWTGRWMTNVPVKMEMLFPNNFIPKFRRVKIYSATIEDLEFYAWKDGEWNKIGEVKGNQDAVIELKFAEEISTIKAKILVTKLRPKMGRAEIYEIEMYN